MENRALVTWVHGPKAENQFKIVQDSFEWYSHKTKSHLIVLDHPPDEKHPLLAKLVIKNIFNLGYDRILFADSDVVFGPDSPDLFEITPPDCFGIRREIFESWKGADQLLTKGLINLLGQFRTVEAEETPHYNTGVMVIPKHYKSVLNYPEVINFPTHHCAEQDYLRHRIHRSCKVFEFDKNDVCIWATDDRERFRKLRTVKHYAGVPDRAEFMQADIYRFNETKHKSEIGIVIGHFGMPGVVELQQKLNENLLGNVPILVSDDMTWQAFDKIDSPELGQKKYSRLLSVLKSGKLNFRIANEEIRCLHSAGDLRAFANGLQWAVDHNIEYLCKLSMRAFITKPNWLQETVQWMKQRNHHTAMHICQYGKNKTYFQCRSEIVVMHVPTWSKGIQLFPNEPYPDAAENLISKIVSKKLDGRVLGPTFFGPDRYQKYPYLFWHDNYKGKEHEGEAEARKLASAFKVDLGSEFHSDVSSKTPGYRGWC